MQRRVGQALLTKMYGTVHRAVWESELIRTCAGRAFSLALVLALAPLAGGSVQATAQLGTARVAAHPVIEDRYPAPETRFDGGVVGRADIAYATFRGFRPLTLDLYLPPRSRAPESGYPLVVFVHGGAWMSGHARHAGAFEDFPGVLASLARRGYVVASLNYRLSGEAAFPAALMDVKIALRWLRARSAAFSADPERVIIWGASAGGQLAGLAALACEEADLDPARTGALAAAGSDELVGQSDCVQGAVLWYSPTDFLSMADQAAHSAPEAPDARYLGCAIPACAARTLALASPISFADAGDPPVLLIHGVRDEVVPFAQSAELEARLLGAGGRVELLALEDVGHSFVGATHEQTRRATLLALERTVAFIDAATRPSPQ